MSHAPVGNSEIIIRNATPADASAIAAVAGLDTSAVPANPALVAEVGGRIRAAVSLKDGTAVADPFHRTSELLAMLRIRAAAINGASGGRKRTSAPDRAHRTALRRLGLA